MSKQTVISARVDETMLDDLDRIAAFHERSRAWVIARLLQQAAARELEYIELVEPALEDGSEEHTSELQSLMRISYAVFCLKKKKQTPRLKSNHQHKHPTT